MTGLGRIVRSAVSLAGVAKELNGICGIVCGYRPESLEGEESIQHISPTLM
jgi:hypothetical protein